MDCQCASLDKTLVTPFHPAAIRSLVDVYSVVSAEIGVAIKRLGMVNVSLSVWGLFPCLVKRRSVPFHSTSKDTRNHVCDRRPWPRSLGVGKPERKEGIIDAGGGDDKWFKGEERRIVCDAWRQDSKAQENRSQRIYPTERRYAIDSQIYEEGERYRK